MKRKIVLIIAICVFLFSAYQLFTIYREYSKGTKEYKEIRETVITRVGEEKLKDKKADSKTGEDEPTGDQFRVDFKKLLEMNEDTIAWIRFDSPDKINYPVVQSSDNSTYLTKTFGGQSNSSGAIFADMINQKDFTDRNTFIYGHNMKNGSMFGELDKYKSAKHCKKYPYFYIYTADGKVRTYQVFATAIVEDGSDSYQVHFTDENAFGSYIEMIRKGALYTTDASVEKTDRIVSLSTCTNATQTQRMIVHGVLIGIEDIE